MSDAGNHPTQMDSPATIARIQELAAVIGQAPELHERLQQLRGEVHVTLHDEFDFVAADLEQLRTLLTDAALKLSMAFREMTGSSQELQLTVQKIAATPELSMLKRLTEIADGMTTTTGLTVQSLQFEDMATQLLAHVNKRLVILEAFAKDMAVLNPPAEGSPLMLAPHVIDELSHTLQRYRAALAGANHKAVQQQSLDSGDIELF